jgi:Tfp pilus assembly protein PilN
VVFSLFLLACLFIINLQGDIVEKEAVDLKKVMVYNEVQKTHESVNEYYQITQQLNDGLSAQVSYINLLEKINDLIPSDLFLQEISIVEAELVINGFSSNRDALIEFRNRLETEESFGSVESPISNFTASENVNFIFTININK